MNNNFDARNAYGFHPGHVFITSTPTNRKEIMEYLNRLSEELGLYELGPDEAEKAREIRNRIWYTCLLDGPKWEYGPEYWYAVMTDDDDRDYSKGSNILEEAKEMARGYPNGYIAVIDEEGDDLDPAAPLVIEELRGDDLMD